MHFEAFRPRGKPLTVRRSSRYERRTRVRLVAALPESWNASALEAGMWAWRAEASGPRAAAPLAAAAAVLYSELTHIESALVTTCCKRCAYREDADGLRRSRRRTRTR